MAPSKEDVLAVCEKLMEPKLKWNLNLLNLVQDITIEANHLSITINLITDDELEINQFKQQSEAAFKRLGFEQVTVQLGRVNVATQGLDNIKHIILVAAGKGGVGKSSIAVNLARALAAANCKVGVLDADIYGPSLPRLLNTQATPEVLPNESLMPIYTQGLWTMSVGYLVPQRQALDWRGQMTSGTLVQFMKNTHWQDLDYLIVDLPPGTGDIVLTLTHQIRCSGVVLVTTPAQITLDDVKRCLSLFRLRQVPIIGVVENMSHLVCENCGHTNALFANTHQELVAQALESPLLATLPLTEQFANLSDLGQDFLRAYPDHEITRQLHHLAQQVATFCSQTHENVASSATETIT